MANLKETTAMDDVKTSLGAHNAWCPDVDVFLSDHANLNYTQAINKYRAVVRSKKSNRGVISQLTNCVALLSEQNETKINDLLLGVLLETEIGLRLLILWRQIKNYDNISDSVKIEIIEYLRGTLPKAIQEDEWTHIKQDGSQYVDEG